MIVVFGSLNIDMVMPVGHFPRPGETVLCSTDYLARPGGKGANQAVAAVRAGARVAMVGKVGDDAFGRRAANNLKTQGILASGIGISDTRPTGCAAIAVDASGENMVMAAPGANLEATADQVPDEILSPRHILLAQMEGEAREIFAVLSRAKQRGATVILNASPAGVLTQEVLKSLHYLIVNEIEARQLAKGLGIAEENPHRLAADFAALAPGLTAIVTMEDKGCVAASGAALWTQEALQVEVVDSTGAGDAFCGIFAARLLAGKPWLEALHYASVGASLSCLGLGAQAGMPFIEDIETALPRVPGPKEIA